MNLADNILRRPLNIAIASCTLLELNAEEGMAKQRLYTEQEFNSILKRTAEKQAEQGTKETVGLSLQEMQQIAAEVGLDPTLLASVVAELDSNPDTRKKLPWYQVPNKVSLERVLQGNLEEDQWPEIVAAIENKLGVSGVSSQIGRMLEWTYSSRFVRYKISFSPGEDQTKVRLFGNFSKVSRIWLIMSMAYSGGFGLLGGMGLFSEGVGIALGLAAVLMAFTLVRLGLINFANNKERKFKHLLTEFEGMIDETEILEMTPNTESDSILPQGSILDEPQVRKDSRKVSNRKKVS